MLRSRCCWNLFFAISLTASGLLSVPFAAAEETSQRIDELMQLRSELVAKTKNPQIDPADLAKLTAELGKLNEQIDHLANARYSHLSGLYWYTDWNAAQQAAAKQHKPILSLRLLGKLTDELSCANSRFFRTILYPNEQIKQELHDHYILHWETVRNAPRITIDFGDGKKIERTITGNSIHYIHAPNGEVIDALPGMYGPARFMANLEKARQTVVAAEKLEGDARRQAIARYHENLLTDLNQAWQRDLKQWLEKTPLTSHYPGVEKLTVGSAPISVNEEAFWTQVGLMHPELGELDQPTREIVLSFRTAVDAGRLARGKAIIELPGMRMVRNLTGALAVDTLRNEYQFRSAIVQWLQAQPELSKNVQLLNRRVYTDLFLMAPEDPWLGLALPDVYTAIPSGGISEPADAATGTQAANRTAGRPRGPNSPADPNADQLQTLVRQLKQRSE